MLLIKSKGKIVKGFFFKTLIVLFVLIILVNFCSCRYQNIDEIYIIALKNAKQSDIELDLLLSIIQTESSFNKNAISNKGACGLMQLMPSTASFIAEKVGYVAVIDLFDIECNIFLGCKYLCYLKEKFITLDLVLCAYNAGEGRVREWLLNPTYSNDGVALSYIPFKETRQYLQKVTNGRKIMKLYLKGRGYYAKAKE